jgi:hypothetical protein
MPLKMLFERIKQAKTQKRLAEANARAIRESNLIKRNLAIETNGKLKLSLLGKEEHSKLSQKRSSKK